MDALLNAALAGTSRAGGQVPPPATPADALVTPAPDLGAERQILLAAGTRAIYRRAGLETRSVAATSVAPDDAAPDCSPGATRLIARMLAGEHNELLAEAFERLNRAGWRLPHTLLPAALDVGMRHAHHRPALLVVIGERGRWLAAHNQPWRWATARPVADEEGLPPATEALWEEGTPAQRLSILRQVRTHDPAQGRAWLEVTWKGEKADFRAEAIKVLAVGLSLDDESFLEAALDDRSLKVSAPAAGLLARVADSALAQRVRGYADGLLHRREGRKERRGLRGMVAALTGNDEAPWQLVVELPEQIDKGWRRDVVPQEVAGAGALPVGERAAWLVHLLALVPLSHWEARFDASPSALVRAMSGGEWAAPVLEGWSRAAILTSDKQWAPALWEAWNNVKGQGWDQQHVTARLGELIPLLPQALAERALANLLSRPPERDQRVQLLEALPTPWSREFGDAFLDGLQRQLAADFPTLFNLRDFFQAAGKIQSPGEVYNWMPLLAVARRALPAPCFPRALAIPLPDGADYAAQAWKRQLSELTDAIQMRQRLMKEIPL